MSEEKKRTLTADEVAELVTGAVRPVALLLEGLWAVQDADVPGDDSTEQPGDLLPEAFGLLPNLLEATENAVAEVGELYDVRRLPEHTGPGPRWEDVYARLVTLRWAVLAMRKAHDATKKEGGHFTEETAVISFRQLVRELTPRAAESDS